jgi:hypothetical protein
VLPSDQRLPVLLRFFLQKFVLLHSNFNRPEPSGLEELGVCLGSRISSAHRLCMLDLIGLPNQNFHKKSLNLAMNSQLIWMTLHSELPWLLIWIPSSASPKLKDGGDG